MSFSTFETSFAIRSSSKTDSQLKKSLMRNLIQSICIVWDRLRFRSYRAEFNILKNV